MNLNYAVNNYLDKVKMQNRKETYRYYNSHLNVLLEFCYGEGIEDLDDLPEDFFYRFVHKSKQKKLTARTINKRMEIFKRMLNHSKINPDLNEIKLSERHKTFERLSEADLKKIINYVHRLSNNKENLTYKIFIMLLFDTGMRINELLHIERNNISLDANSILLTTTKTGKDRFAFFTNYTKLLLNEYLKHNVNHDLLLHNYNTNNPLTYRSVRVFLSKIKKEYNISKLHPHMFRHTFASLLIDNGADIYSVMRLLGHSSVRTTEIYLHNNEKKNYMNYQQFHKSVDVSF